MANARLPGIAGPVPSAALDKENHSIVWGAGQAPDTIVPHYRTLSTVFCKSGLSGKQLLRRFSQQTAVFTQEGGQGFEKNPGEDAVDTGFQKVKGQDGREQKVDNGFPGRSHI